MGNKLSVAERKGGLERELEFLWGGGLIQKSYVKRRGDLSKQVDILITLR